MKNVWVVCVLGLAIASASVMAGVNFPWDVPLARLSQNLTGPTSSSIALIGLFVAGGALVFGGDLGDFAKRITWMVLAISLMLGGSSFINILSNGAALPAAAGAML